MRMGRLMVTAISAMLVTGAAFADPPAGDDDLVRLPGNGEIRKSPENGKGKAESLVPGGGLMITFDANMDGRITPVEVSDGSKTAFGEADSNGDGWLSALEQIDWARQLPTRDDTLANPTRFDPNLDRMVDIDEFAAVVARLAQDYSDKATGDILVASLKVVEPEPNRGAFARLMGQRSEN